MKIGTMKIEQKYLNQFDKAESVLVISSYPPKNGESAKQNAVANYTRELVEAMKKQAPIMVLCEIIDKPQTYIENGILVIRCFYKNDLRLTWDILRIISQFSNVETIMVQFEFNIFGGVVATGSTAILFSLIKLLGKKTTFVFHQVVDEISDLAGHLGLSADSIKTRIFSLGMQTFYRMIGKFADGVIVHEDFLKIRLSKFIPKHLISVIPHGVNLLKQKIYKSQARKKLGLSSKDIVILAFGYISWYKGSDWLVKKVSKYIEKYPNKPIKLILAGGESPTLKHRPYYQKYLQNLNLLVQKYSKQIKITGYVPDSQKDYYFAACDVVVLPYRAAMSASGPMSQTFAHGKPFLVSESRFASLTNFDIALEMQNNNIIPKDVAFFMKNGSFDNKLSKLLSSPDLLERLSIVSVNIGKARDWFNTSNLYLKAMHKGYHHLAKVIEKPMYKLPELSVFFPLYNEEKNIVSLVKKALLVLPNIAKKFEIILVNDGSNDKTACLVDKLVEKHNNQVKGINQNNIGYGGAIKRGFLESKYDWIFYSDGDLQFDLKELENFVQYCQIHDMVLGYRLNRADGLKRQIIASLLKIWNKVWLDFPMSIKDTDCAFKLINRKVIDRIQPLQSNGAMISTEMLLKSYHMGASFTQIGVRHYPRLAGKSTGSNMKVILQAIWDTLSLRKIFKAGKENNICRDCKLART